MVRLPVLNPVAQSAGNNRFHAAKRPADLRRKKIGLYDNSKPRGDVAQQRLIEVLGARCEGVEFRRYNGSIGGRSTLTAKGAAAIVKDCDAVIGIRAD